MGLKKWLEDQIYDPIVTFIFTLLLEVITLPSRLVLEVANIYVPEIDPLFREPMTYSKIPISMSDVFGTVTYVSSHTIHLADQVLAGGLPYDAKTSLPLVDDIEGLTYTTGMVTL